MRLAVLYSGGKDSTLALMKASKLHEVVCLVSVVSDNKHSFMFHTPNIDITSLQAKALGLPLVQVKSAGLKEAELVDLERAIRQAKEEHNIEGVVTGAVRSTYQASRVQRICYRLGLWCFNPLWLIDQHELLHDVLKNNIKPVISGVFAEPLDESYLGKLIDKDMVHELIAIEASHHISPAGEGGEIETTVLDCPAFKKRIEVTKSSKKHENFTGFFTIDDARLADR